MKSIIEEASSIAKAIEKGWAKAGHPKEFSVKVFEEPQKNFIGLTTKSAKIGIFFNEFAVSKSDSSTLQRHKQPITPSQATPQFTRQKNVNQLDLKVPKDQSKFVPQRSLTKQFDTQKETVEKEVGREQVWSEEMVESCERHMRKVLELMGHTSVGLKLEPQYFHLKIYLDNMIIEDFGRQKQFFSSLSTLLLQMLKHQFRRPLKGYKIILISV